jgi:hypothetical protein
MHIGLFIEDFLQLTQMNMDVYFFSSNNSDLFIILYHNVSLSIINVIVVIFLDLRIKSKLVWNLENSQDPAHTCTS